MKVAAHKTGAIGLRVVKARKTKVHQHHAMNVALVPSAMNVAHAPSAANKAHGPSAKSKGLAPSAKNVSSGPNKDHRVKAMLRVVIAHQENPKTLHNQEIQLRTVLTSQKEIAITAVEAGEDIRATADQKAMKPEQIQRPPIRPHESFRLTHNNPNLPGIVRIAE
jgi:hypothetical protein